MYRFTCNSVVEHDDHIEAHFAGPTADTYLGSMTLQLPKRQKPEIGREYQVELNIAGPVTNESDIRSNIVDENSTQGQERQAHERAQTQAQEARNEESKRTIHEIPPGTKVSPQPKMAAEPPRKAPEPTPKRR